MGTCWDNTKREGQAREGQPTPCKVASTLANGAAKRLLGICGPSEARDQAMNDKLREIGLGA